MNDSQQICRFCRESINPSAKKCPHCQQWQGYARWLIFLPGILVMATMVGFMYFTFDRMGRDGESFSLHHDQVTIASSRMHYRSDPECSSVILVGTIENRSAIPWERVEIEVRYFDDAGELIDTASETLYMTVPARDEAIFKVATRAAKTEEEYSRFTVRIRSAEDARDSF